MDDDALILWQDVLDEVAAGRTGALSCPHCGHTPLAVETDPQSHVTKISCSKCSQFLQGRFASA